MSIIESKHFINNQEVRPKDADLIGLKLDWIGDAQETELNVDTLVLENKAKKLVLDHVNTYGVFEGVPYTFQINNFSLNYYIDLTDPNTKISGVGDSSIEVTIKKRKGISTFWENAYSLSFEAVNKTNPINNVPVDYLIVPDNQIEMIITTSISTFTLAKALEEGFRDIAIASTELLKQIFLGTGVLLGQIISAVVLLVARVIYVIALVKALIKMAKQIIDLIYPPIKTFKGSTVLELMNKGCQKLGFKFESYLLNEIKDLTICPVPLQKNAGSILDQLVTLDNTSYTKGYPTSRDSVPTLGTLMQSLKETFNGKFRIVNDTVYFERRDFWNLTNGLAIQNTLNLQNVRENQWQYNVAEAWKRYYINYRLDPTDYLTMDAVEKSDCEYSTEPLTTSNNDLINIKGLVDISIPFSLGIRKDKLTFVENFAKEYAKLADKVINFFNGDSSFESKVNARIGVMMIGQQYFQSTKLLYCLNGKQPVNYLDTIGADNIYKKYHTINQVKENFKKIYSATIPFSTAQFEQLLYNNYVQDSEGNLLEILTFEWTNESKEAEIMYSIESNEGFNTETIKIDG